MKKFKKSIRGVQYSIVTSEVKYPNMCSLPTTNGPKVAPLKLAVFTFNFQRTGAQTPHAELLQK